MFSCVFGNVRGNIWTGPLGMLRIGGGSLRLPFCIPGSKYFAAAQNCSCDRHLCEILSNWNSLLIVPLPLLWEVLFTSRVRCNLRSRTLCSFSCIQWTGRHKRWEWWGVASGEKPLRNVTFSTCVRDLFLSGRTVHHWSYTGKGVFVQKPSSVWDSGRYSEDFNKAIEQKHWNLS